MATLDGYLVTGDVSGTSASIHAKGGFLVSTLVKGTGQLTKVHGAFSVLPPVGDIMTFRMRGWVAAQAKYVYWSVIGVPDSTGTQSGFFGLISSIVVVGVS